MNTRPEQQSAFGGDLTPLSQSYPTEYAAPGAYVPRNPIEDIGDTDTERSAEPPTTTANTQAEFHRSVLGSPEAPDSVALAWVAPIKQALDAAQPDLAPDRRAYVGGVGELLNESRRATAAEYAGSALNGIDSHSDIQAAVQKLQEDSPTPQESLPPQS